MFMRGKYEARDKALVAVHLQTVGGLKSSKNCTGRTGLWYRQATLCWVDACIPSLEKRHLNYRQSNKNMLRHGMNNVSTPTVETRTHGYIVHSTPTSGTFASLRERHG